MTDSKALIKTTKLTKDFGNHKGAFDIDMEVRAGEIVGFIGPNGAGKTTTMSMLVGFTKPTSGNFEIFGDPNVNYQNIHKIMPRLGVLLSDVAFEPNFTAERIFIENQKLLDKDLTKNWRKMADYLDLDITKKFKKLSLGNKKKVGIVNALMHEPELVIMDEPTSGLDPLIQQRYLELIKQLKNKGGAVLLSSHVLSEVQAACDYILMIKNGELILNDSTENILAQAIKVFRVESLNSDDLEEMEQKNLIDKWEDRGVETMLYTRKRESVLKFLVKKNIYDFYLEKPNLEDMFLKQY